MCFYVISEFFFLKCSFDIIPWFTNLCVGGGKTGGLYTTLFTSSWELNSKLHIVNKIIIQGETWGQNQKSAVPSPSGQIVVLTCGVWNTSGPGLDSVASHLCKHGRRATGFDWCLQKAEQWFQCSQVLKAAAAAAALVSKWPGNQRDLALCQPLWPNLLNTACWFSQDVSGALARLWISDVSAFCLTQILWLQPISESINSGGQ